MKIPFTSFIFLTLFGLSPMEAHTIEIADLSLTPPRDCKKSPKKPPFNLIHKNYRAYEIGSNYPFINSVDINGDGWCDWVSMSAGPPHRGDIDEPTMVDFIFLGTSMGWRKFGNMKKFLSDRSELTSPSVGWLAPNVPASGFIFPTFVYSTKNFIPFFVTLSSNEDIAPSSINDISVLQWDNTFDMARNVSNIDKKIVIKFLKNKLCDFNKDYQNTLATSMENVICRKKNADNWPSK